MEKPNGHRSEFTKVLSLLMLGISAMGGFYVLMQPGFSADLRGAVVTTMLIGGYTALQTFWLGSSNSSQMKDERNEVPPALMRK